MKKIAFLFLLLSCTGPAFAISRIGGVAHSDAHLHAFEGAPTLLDLIKQQELLDWARQLDFEKFAEPWVAVGCTVEGMSELDRIICPGFRVDPRTAPEVSVQWSAYDFSKLKPAKVKEEPKSEFDGRI